MEWAAASVAAARVARLATTGPDGRVDLVPITFALLDADDRGGDGPAAVRLVTAIDHKPKTTRQLRRLDNVRSRPDVGVLIDHYDDEDWQQLWWVRLTGTARVIETGDDLTASVDALVAKYPQYREIRPGGPVIEVTTTRWQSWSAADRGAP